MKEGKKAKSMSATRKVVDLMGVGTDRKQGCRREQPYLERLVNR